MKKSKFINPKIFSMPIYPELTNKQTIKVFY